MGDADKTAVKLRIFRFFVKVRRVVTFASTLRIKVMAYCMSKSVYHGFWWRHMTPGQKTAMTLFRRWPSSTSSALHEVTLPLR